MEKRGLLREFVSFGEYRIYEFRIGTPDIEGVDALGAILRKAVEDGGDKKSYEAIFGNVASLLRYPEIWHVFSAGLRMSIEDCKKIKQQILIQIFPKILEVNKYFFSETPEMLGRIQAVLIPELSEGEKKILKTMSSQQKE